MAKKPNPAVTNICVICGQSFHPWRGREQEQRFCSRRCSSTHGNRTQQELWARQAKDSRGAKGTESAKSLRSKASRVQTPDGLQPDDRRPGERGAATGTRRGSVRTAPLPPETTPMGGTSHDDLSTPVLGKAETAHPDDQEAEEWRGSGERFERLTTYRLARERGRGRSRTLVLAGYGAGIRVERDALTVTEGYTHAPQSPLTHTLYRGMHDVGRIVCLNPSGSLSFPAVRWCADQGIVVILLGRSGELLATFTPDADTDVALRRRQYLAQTRGQDLVISRELVRRKLEGHLQTLKRHLEVPGGARATEILTDALSWLRLPIPPTWLESIDLLRSFEGRAASAYFGAWVGVRLHWTNRDAQRVPPHWRCMRARNSPLSHNGIARHAVDPANAILNYAYALLEGQTRAALTAQGFDPACGFLHADKDGRDSLVYDLMELRRADVDDLVLSLLKAVTLHKCDFTPVSDGTCRLHPQLARAVVASCRVEQTRIDADARWLRDAVLAADGAGNKSTRGHAPEDHSTLPQPAARALRSRRGKKRRESIPAELAAAWAQERVF